MPIKRILFDIAFLLSIAFLPWFVAPVFIIVGIIFFPLFIEALIGALAIDILFGHGFPFSIVTAFVFLVSLWLKAYIR